MAHAKYTDLYDLEPLLDNIRSLPDIREPRPGIFYLKRTPFLHFHTRAGERWADAKAGSQWGPEIPVPFEADSTCLAAVWDTLQARHLETQAILVPQPRKP
jgi:hypothetical protein